MVAYAIRARALSPGFRRTAFGIVVNPCWVTGFSCSYLRGEPVAVVTSLSPW
jgi:hypothetical protein